MELHIYVIFFILFQINEMELKFDVETEPTLKKYSLNHPTLITSTLNQKVTNEKRNIL